MAYPYSTTASLKPKDLIGQPWRLAFALQADGWYLRSEIIWAKPNPMPESVTDRPTKAHETLFLLTKSARYFYDADAIREPHNDRARPNGPGGRDGVNHSAYVPREKDGIARLAWKRGNNEYNPAGRNKRSWWEIATQPYSAAHFATFPEALVEPCILAGTSAAGCCAECGAPRVRETETMFVKQANRLPSRKLHPSTRDGLTADINSHEAMGHNVVTTTGWAAGCAHDAPTVPCVVLDPFSGSFTTAVVARKLGRRWIGIDLSPEYAELGRKRLEGVSLPLGIPA